MTREEFDRILTENGGNPEEVSEPMYKDIEFVYTFHPAISETDGKTHIAKLFITGGIAVIRDMKETAVMARGIEEDLRMLRAKEAILKNRMEMLKDGNKSVENALSDLMEVYGSGTVDESKEMYKRADVLKSVYGEMVVSIALDYLKM